MGITRGSARVSRVSDRTFLMHANHFSERAESTQFIALAAELNDSFGARSIIAFPRHSVANNQERIDEARGLGLELLPYSSPAELRGFAKNNHVDLSFVATDGSLTGVAYSRERPEDFRLGDSLHVLHVVFRNYAPHGDFYLYVSEWLFEWSRRQRARTKQEIAQKSVSVGALPYGLAPPAPRGRDFRNELGIPKDAFVIARIGGFDTFDDLAAHNALRKILEQTKDVYFVAVNTATFYSHPRIMHLNYLDRSDISDFYVSFDLFLNARLEGESFGFSIAEPLSHGKPVLAPHWLRNHRMDRNHISLLQGLGLLYLNSLDLRRKIKRTMLGPAVSPSTLESRVSSYSISRLAQNLVLLCDNPSGDNVFGHGNNQRFFAPSLLPDS